MAQILGPRYQDEASALADDPIIHEMARDIFDAEDEHRIDEISEEWDFIQNARLHYRRRGGKHSSTIGGVARAVRAAVKRELGEQTIREEKGR